MSEVHCALNLEARITQRKWGMECSLAYLVPGNPFAMFYLSKLLPLFVLPVGLTLSALLVGLVLRFRWLIWMAVVLLWISSSPPVGQWMMRAAEASADRVPVTEGSQDDAIVVLSSGRSIAPGSGRVSEWGDAARFFGGVELFGTGKARLLVFTGAGQG